MLLRELRRRADARHRQGESGGAHGCGFRQGAHEHERRRKALSRFCYENNDASARDRSARQREDIAQRHRNRLRLCRIKRRLADMAQRGRADDGR